MGYLALLPASLILASGLQVAQSPAPPERVPGQSALGALDADRDGSISPVEAQANPALSAQFPALDQNTNGALEPAEFARFDATAPPPAGAAPRHFLAPSISIPPPLDRIPPPMGVSPPPTGASPPATGTSPTPDGSSPPPTGN
jgi:hypothetical protein